MKLSRLVVWTIIYLLSKKSVRKKGISLISSQFRESCFKNSFFSKKSPLVHLSNQKVTLLVLKSFAGFLSSDWLLKSAFLCIFGLLTPELSKSSSDNKPKILNVFYENG